MSRETTTSFDTLLRQVRALATGDGGPRARARAICDLLRAEVPHYDWVGFYLVDPPGSRDLVLGPYSGAPTDHTHIPFGRGICGQAAEREETFVIQDVSQEDNYLACSVHVQSEIVLPMFAADGALIGELDIDSHALAPFTDADETFLAAVCQAAAPLFGGGAL
jgi:GAF domain-containing protein